MGKNGGVLHRAIALPRNQSFFLLGPRGTGKSTLLRSVFPDAPYIDLLDVAVYTELLMHPERLEARALPVAPERIVIDEIQRLPRLLDEVHRLIEPRRWRRPSRRSVSSWNKSARTHPCQAAAAMALV